MKDQYKTVGEIVMIPRSRIFIGDARRHSAGDANSELVSSICKNGLLEPLIVRKISQNKYSLVSGERRYNAALAAGLRSFPCIILSCDRKNSEIFSLIDNIQQKPLSYFDEAKCMNKIMRDCKMSASELAEKISKTPEYVLSKIKLLSIPEDIRDKMINAGLSEGYANLLLILSDEDKEKVVDRIIKDDLSLSETKKEIEAYSTGTDGKKNRMFFSDVTVFVNTIDQTLGRMGSCGISVFSKKTETDNSIEYMIRIGT